MSAMTVRSGMANELKPAPFAASAALITLVHVAVDPAPDAMLTSEADIVALLFDDALAAHPDSASTSAIAIAIVTTLFIAFLSLA